jgi:hypothetical protein
VSLGKQSSIYDQVISESVYHTRHNELLREMKGGR